MRTRLAGALLATISALTLWLAPLSTSTLPSADYLPTSHSDPAPQSATGSPQSAVAAPLSTGSTGSVYFRQTAHSIKDAFLNYWLMQGGVPLYGYPVSEEFTLNGVPMQYFERARFEYHANSARPWHVDLSNLGSMLTQGRNFPRVTASAATGDRIYFDQTGHTLGGAFKQFWSSKGDLAVFGYPISEEIVENNRTVQYFERARFEMTPGGVQLGLLGNEMLQRHLGAGLDPNVATPQNRPGFNMSFYGQATWFRGNWDRIISLNKLWGNLPQDYVGRGLYAAAPADLGLYGRWARVTKGNRSIYVQFVDVIDWKDIPYVRGKGIVIDLGYESFLALDPVDSNNYNVSFDVFWPDQQPEVVGRRKKKEQVARPALSFCVYYNKTRLLVLPIVFWRGLGDSPNGRGRLGPVAARTRLGTERRSCALVRNKHE